MSSYREIDHLPSFRDRPLFRLALVSALAASFALAGCGRKGPLDPPPGASLEGVPQANMPELMSDKGNSGPIGGQAKGGYTGVDEKGQPVAPKGPQKRIFLDGLLN
jgi:predicted small lipoprotein YifL